MGCSMARIRCSLARRDGERILVRKVFRQGYQRAVNSVVTSPSLKPGLSTAPIAGNHIKFEDLTGEALEDPGGEWRVRSGRSRPYFDYGLPYHCIRMICGNHALYKNVRHKRNRAAVCSIHRITSKYEFAPQ